MGEGYDFWSRTDYTSDFVVFMKKGKFETTLEKVNKKMFLKVVSMKTEK